MMQNNQHPETSSSSHLAKPFQTTPLYAVSTDAPEDPVTTGDNQRPPGRVRVSSPEDVLAYVQCTLGFRVTDSLVVVAFSGSQLSTVVRCDLPETLQHMLRSDTPESVTFMDFGMTESQELQLLDIGRHIGQLMAKEPATTSCVLAYLSDDVAVSDQQALSVAGTANYVIAAQFGVQGVAVEESWLIHHDLLWHLRCAATTECEVQGTQMGDPELTAIFRELDPKGATSKQYEVAARQLIFPPASADVPRNRPASPVILEDEPQVIIDWLKLWDENLCSGPTLLHSNQVAQLLTSVEHSRVRETVVALACFDFTTAVRGMVTLGHFPTQLATAAQVNTNLLDGLTVQDCMTAQSDRVPDWPRVNELQRLCHQLLPLSDALSGGVVAGILAWIEWAKGRGTIASRYVQRSRQRFPDDQFLITLEGYLRQGLVAGWATRLESAWSPQHAA